MSWWRYGPIKAEGRDHNEIVRLRAEVDALRAAAVSDLRMLSDKIDALIGHGHAVDKNTELLRDVVNKLCSRVDVLEVKQKK